MPTEAVMGEPFSCRDNASEVVGRKGVRRSWGDEAIAKCENWRTGSDDRGSHGGAVQLKRQCFGSSGAKGG